MQSVWSYPSSPTYLLFAKSQIMLHPAIHQGSIGVVLFKVFPPFDRLHQTSWHITWMSWCIQGHQREPERVVQQSGGKGWQRDSHLGCWYYVSWQKDDFMGRSVSETLVTQKVSLVLRTPYREDPFETKAKAGWLEDGWSSKGTPHETIGCQVDSRAFQYNFWTQPVSCSSKAYADFQIFDVLVLSHPFPQWCDIINACHCFGRLL